MGRGEADLTPEQTVAWLDLLARGVDRRWLSELLRLLAGPAEILGASDAELAAAAPIARANIPRLRTPPPRDIVSRQADVMARHRMRLLPMTHPGFPRNMFEMRVPPPAIFIRGEVEDIDALAVGIVGPREATIYGTSVAKALSRDFARHFTVISGAALGIDSDAHQAALDAGGRTIAVIGCGLDVNYPARNEGLRRRIVEEGRGAIISIFPPGTQPLRGNFPQRNVVLAGMSLAVIVAEAGPRSGALVTARAAGEEGRPVYAVPGDITRTNSQGANGLLRDGASVCTSAQDVIADLEGMLAGELEALRQRRQARSARAAIASDNGAEPSRGEPAAPLGRATPAEATLMRVLAKSPTHHDELINQFVPSMMTLGDLSTALLMMELDGRIEQLPGRIYQIKL